MCLYVAHSSTQTCRHALKAPTMHTKSTLTLLLKLDIRLSGMKNLQEETDFFQALSKMKMSELLMKTNPVELNSYKYNAT